MLDLCKKAIIKNSNGNYLISMNTNKGKKFLGKLYDKEEDACKKVIEYLRKYPDIKILPKYCYY